MVLIITFLLLIRFYVFGERQRFLQVFCFYAGVSRAKLIAVKIAAGMIYAAAVILGGGAVHLFDYRLCKRFRLAGISCFDGS